MIHPFFTNLTTETRRVTTNAISIIKSIISPNNTEQIARSTNISQNSHTQHQTTRPLPTTTSQLNNNGSNRSKSIRTATTPTPTPILFNQSLFSWLQPRIPQLTTTATSIIEIKIDLQTADPQQTISHLPDHYIQLTQLSQEEMASHTSSHLEPWGDPIPKTDACHTLRIVYQNVHHSFQSSPSDPRTLQIIENLQNLDCGIFCASETNINWHNKTNKYNIQQTFQKNLQPSSHLHNNKRNRPSPRTHKQKTTSWRECHPNPRPLGKQNL